MPLVLLSALLLQFLLLFVHCLQTFPRNKSRPPGRISRDYPAFLKLFQSPQQGIVLPFETVHRRLAEVCPLLCRVVLHHQYAHARRYLTTAADLSLQLK